ncbi:MAG: hypothetical protein NZ898_17255, partial [Myxococcota bacterium]|nr:hypothetical protein [Myxococcota bacterium]
GSLASALPLTRAGRTRVYVGMGRYEESVDLEMPVAGLVIDGGWDVRGAVWRRDCARGRDGTLFASPTSVGGVIRNATGGLTLRNLTIATNPFTGPAPEGMSGRSSIGLVVRGEESVVVLENVVIHAGHGQAAGAAPSAPDAPEPVCDGVSGCRRDSMDGGGGVPGEPGYDGDAVMVSGTFDATGYHPVDGRNGAMGGNGGHGARGTWMSVDVAQCCMGGCSSSDNCMPACPAATLHLAGLCGCGGRAAAPGSGGRGGGASVALLVAERNAWVEARWSGLRSGHGGAGSRGGIPGRASMPTEGRV